MTEGEDPLSAWQARVEAGQLQFDPAQQQAAATLTRIQQQLNRSHKRRLFSHPRAIEGLYLWGAVGRGKTLLMDLFYQSLNPKRATRLHFHRFMQRIHRQLRELGDRRDPLARIAADWPRGHVLCFDEFHVSDIADAMLLGELLKKLFARDLTLIATSNTAPDQLYAGGLQRQRFLPAIEALKGHCQVLELRAAGDYRLRILDRAAVYFQPIDTRSEEHLRKLYQRLSPGKNRPQADLRLNGRTFYARERGDGVVWFDFTELCEKPRGTNDYIELARQFNTVLISGLPRFGPHNRDSLRRFIHLVDEFYDRGVKLILEAEAEVKELYQGKAVAFEFERCRSRLLEMQSREYLARAHRP